MKRWYKLISLLFIGVLVMAGCSSSGGGTNSQAGQEIAVTSEGELASLDTIKSSDSPSLNVASNTIEGLYRPAPQDSDKLKELGMAAEEPEISEDGKTYTYKIREDAKWSTGEPVTAHDFVYTYRKAVTPPELSQNVNRFFPINKAKEISEGKESPENLGVKALDDKTLEFTLTSPTAYFEDLLGTPAFLPQSQKLAEEVGDDYGSSAKKTAFNGPFLVEGWTGTENSFDLVKNPDYWDAENVQLNRINWEVSKELQTNYNLFNSGDVQYTQTGNPYVEQLAGEPILQTSLNGKVGYLQFNFDKPILKNKHVRQALRSGFDKEAFTQAVLKDGSQSLDGWVPADHVSDPASGQDFRAMNGHLGAYDLDFAQSEWKLAKQELGLDHIELELLTSDTDTSKATSEFLQGEWQNNLPGLTVTIRNVPLKSRQQITNTGEYDMVYGTYHPSYVDPTAYLDYFHSQSALNNANFDSENYDSLLATAQNELGDQPEARFQKLLEAERYLMEDEAALGTIYQGAYAFLVDPKLTGVINQTNGVTNYFRAATYQTEN
ncbi:MULTISPECIES: peptide ABC transporter substrate-binding protein [Aerococcus]|uniref:Peptide ABC transporter substrate-binding protein n=2 Tax=Aerococcus TaxID=1375 RepID=A0A178HFW2_9LACT|nr:MULTISPECIES: peptide ABC transporter substrate-binding protein [Aerococcus]KAA9221088.1 peptide ABC transporter substrate-binding protein [Aerococcus loyolae]KAA9264690.1 peptide ABC transporter substrate-binding protein [Aerococcus loyolae]MCY3026275.1 peptide ABC transporter substrate-binding protein [Aerococcus loyolae]MCY3026669.1 peptide ABC transporter substrate-binding protein [Aerococcus loyolae]MCY3029823.1 peptide ABC transporter substrate-binding protein [Aerococcus loyolae]